MAHSDDSKQPVRDAAAAAADPEPAGSVPQPNPVPRPTYWPAMLALSASFALWGVLTSVYMVAVGVAGVLVSAAHWVGEVRDEQRRHAA